MERNETFSAMAPLLRSRMLRMVLVGAPGLTAAVAIIIATEPNMGLAVILNASVGVIISSALFIVVSRVAHRAANERANLVKAAEQGFWHARAQLLSIHHEETSLYTEWYFRLRVQEEMERSTRYDLKFGILVIRPIALHQEAEVPAAGDWLSSQINDHLRRSDLVALLKDGHLAVLLPNASKRSAQNVRRRLAKALATVEASVGLSCFPEDGGDADALLRTASAAATGPVKKQVA